MRGRFIPIAVAARREIGTGAEVLAQAAQDDDARIVVTAADEELTRQFVQHQLVERIGAFGPIEQDCRNAARR